MLRDLLKVTLLSGRGGAWPGTRCVGLGPSSEPGVPGARPWAEGSGRVMTAFGLLSPLGKRDELCHIQDGSPRLSRTNVHTLHLAIYCFMVLISAYSPAVGGFCNL